MRRAIAALLVLAGWALPDDGAAAHPDRWTHPRGPASQSGVSLAWPPETFGGFVWTWKAKDAIAAPPLTWDGAVFLLDGAALVALDAHSGREWARTAVKDPGGYAVSGRNVYVVEGGKTLVQHQLAGRTFVRGWTYEGGAGAAPPRVIEDEIYLQTAQGLFSLRAGRSQPVWSVAGNFVGEPAVRDGHVYALRREGERVFLRLYARADGREAGELVVADRGKGGRIVVGRHVAAAEVGDGEWAVLSREAAEGGGVKLELARTEKLLSEPFAGSHILMALLDKPREWAMLRSSGKDATSPIAPGHARKDLVEGAAAPVWLGESSQCFGTWCGDVNSNAIFWHVAERPEGKPLAAGVKFPAVPLTHGRVLLVPKDGRTLMALGPEQLG